MLNVFRKIVDLLVLEERRKLCLLFFMVLIMALLDVMGVASVAPFIAVLSDPDIVERNKYLFFFYQYFGFADSEEFLFFLGEVVFLLLVGSIVFKALTTYILLRFTHMQDYSISKRLIGGYLHQPYDWFLNRNSAELGKTVLSEVEKVINYALIPMVFFIVHSVVVIVLMLLFVTLDPVLAITVFGCIGGAYVGIYLFLRRYLGVIGKDRVQANSERFKVVQELFGGIKEVKVSGIESAFLARFINPAKRYAERQAASQAAVHLPRYFLEVIAFGGLMLVILYLLDRVSGIQEVLPVLAIYAFGGYRLMPAAQNVYSNLSLLRFGSPALNILHAELSQLERCDNGFDGSYEIPITLKRGIIIENISYSYPGVDRSVLSNVSINISAYTTVGLVGTTGAGKTSLVDILLGLLLPQNGRILVDDALISSGNIRSWQNMIGYVPQHIYLVDDTVRANIAFGVKHENIDLLAVEKAARIANLHDFVMNEMPDRYDCVVGERGVRLSGGQRQRIGIARALYHDPELLILDEATSALDNLTEVEVMDAVNNLANRKTIILIAHRLTTVRKCDNIIFMDHGKVVCQGRYDKLLEISSEFRKMAEG